ncbi:MAG: CBS domain-containing protein [Nitrospirota bacterium]|nr:CBS domain-containing protein [Nitrospirota bacterium]
MTTITAVMTKKLQSIPGERSVAEATRRMRDDRIGSLLVEQTGEYVGIVTETDVVRKGVAEGRDLEKLPVEKIMSSPMAGIESIRSVQDAHDMMADLGIRHLVVREAGKVIGVLSVRDLLVYFKSVSEPKIAQD